MGSWKMKICLSLTWHQCDFCQKLGEYADAWPTKYEVCIMNCLSRRKAKRKHKYGCQFENGGHNCIIFARHWDGTYVYSCVRYEVSMINSVLKKCTQTMTTISTLTTSITTTDNSWCDWLIGMSAKYEPNSTTWNLTVRPINRIFWIISYHVWYTCSFPLRHCLLHNKAPR